MRSDRKLIVKRGGPLDRPFEEDNLSDRERLDLQVRHWRDVHKCLHARPLHPDRTLPRAAQWHQLATHVVRQVSDPELSAWLAEQVAVADNLATGVQDMRPRKSGPVQALLLEWVADRKHKAHAVLKWSDAAHDAAQEAGDAPHWKPTGGTMNRSKPRKAPTFSAAPDYRKPEKRY